MAATQPAPSLLAEVSSVDIIRLIQHHLIECGLHESCRTLCEESGIGAVATHANLKSLCSTGQWGGKVIRFQSVRWKTEDQYWAVDHKL